MTQTPSPRIDPRLTPQDDSFEARPRDGLSILRRFRNLSAATLGGVLLLFLAAACSGSATDSPTLAPSPTPQFGGPEVSAFIASMDLAVGTNRVVFALLDRDGMPLRVPEAQVQAVYIAPGQTGGVVRDTAAAKFVKWPLGDVGVFVTELSFDKPGVGETGALGVWQLVVTTAKPDGTIVEARGVLRVRETSATPQIGSPAPASITPTVDDVEDLSSITSSLAPDPDLYRISIHDALEEDKPLVVVFATPAFCQSATCGPQVEVLSELNQRYGDQVNFVHVEVFKNPHEIRAGYTASSYVDAVREWKLPGDPWTFVVNRQGLVHAKFEAFTTREEIEAALSEVLSSP